MRLGAVIRKWRSTTETPLRVLAKEIGIPLSTLARIETGDDCNGETLALILVWLMRDAK